MTRLISKLSGRARLGILITLATLGAIAAVVYAGKKPDLTDPTPAAAAPARPLTAAELGYKPVRPAEPNPAAAAAAKPASALSPRERALQEQANRDDAQRRDAILKGAATYHEGLARRAQQIEAQRRAGVEVMP